MTLRPRSLTLLAAALAGLVTLLISVAPFVSFAYRSKPVHVAIETAATLIALLVAMLVAGRFSRSGSLSDLLLSVALFLLAGSNLLFSLFTALSQASPGEFEIWAPVGGRLIGATAFAAAAFAPAAMRVARRRRALLLALVGSAAALAALAGLAALLLPVLPSGLHPAVSPEGSGRPRVVGPAGLLAVQVLIMALYFAAAVGFVRKAEATRDELMTWFAVGSAVAGFARLNYFLFPSIYSEWVYTGDFLRVSFYLLLLAGAGREIASYQRELAKGAVLDERRRMARDLHDGLAQDLAFISSQARRWAGGPAPEVAADVSLAADRALDQSRDAIAALTSPDAEPLDAAIARAAEEVAGRMGARVRFELAGDLEAPPEKREALVRIVREAVTNATRHGRARTVAVKLSNRGGIVLRVVDDGSGFDPEAPGRRHGFGLVSMRERAEALGGRLDVSSTSGRGTEVEVWVP